MNRVKRVDAVASMLLRVLRHTVERGRVSVEDCADVARAQLARPGGPAHGLPREMRARVFVAVDLLSKQMAQPPTPRALYAFAKAAAEAACAVEKGPRHPGLLVEQKEAPRELAVAALYAEAAHARDGEDLVRRAVTRALKAKKRKGTVARVDLAEGDPLRALLDLPARGRVFLPRNDVRSRLAALAGSDRSRSPLGEALTAAARFSEELVRPALGEELWELARPVGLSTRSASRAVVEVQSSTAAQEAHLRKREIVEGLRRVPGLERISDVEISVRSPSVLPVLGGRLGAGPRDGSAPGRRGATDVDE